MKKLILTTLILFSTTMGFTQTSKTMSTSTTESTTVSITDSDHNYSLTAIFNSNQEVKIEEILKKALGKPEEIPGSTYSWVLPKTYTVILKSGRLLMDLNKEIAAVEWVKKFEKLGIDIQSLLAPSKA